ncbi:MAG: cytochrome b [Proteobacteria bacterium]|nr:cytochrome b [Pseudomonadota bacterium]
MTDVDVLPAAEAGGRAAPRYDGLTITFHWVTALLVVSLFALAELWGFVPKKMPLRHEMISLHVSLGVLLAVVYLLRVLWRRSASRHLPPADRGLQHVAARLVHIGFYVLLAVQVTLGFLFAWAKGAIGVFGLFSIASPVTVGRVAHHWIAALHDDVAWVIIILAGGHAMMALAHHYVIRDRVLHRMLPVAAGR